MQIVIDVPEHIYEHIKEVYEHSHTVEATYSYIYHGTPLPKGHGRLIDISPYEKYFNTAISYDDGNHINEVYTNSILTIIEADTESEE